MPWDSACGRNWLRAEKSALTAREKSAKGVVGDEAGGSYWGTPSRKAEQTDKPSRNAFSLKARTVPREGIEREEQSFVEERGYGIRRARAFMG